MLVDWVKRPEGGWLHICGLVLNKGASKEKDFENRLKEEEDEHKKKVEFKAHAAKVLDQAPFVPKASRKPLVEFKEFQLATNERAEVWEENEQKKAEKEAE